MRCTTAVICACALLGWAAEARAAALATVVSVKGSVQVMHKGRSRPAEVGVALEAGDTVTTRKGATVWLVHRSGRLEKVGPGQRVSLAAKPAPERGRLASLLRGLGLFGTPETAQLVFDDPLCLTFVKRVLGQDERRHAIGSISNIVIVVVVHTYREESPDEIIRIMSARRATSRERRLYEEADG